MASSPPYRHPNHRDESRSNKSLRMGGVAKPPPNFSFIGPINYNQCAIGRFVDLAGIIRVQSAIFNGRIINLRRYHRSFSPQLINFNSTSLWVRIHGLPFLYLTREWATQILSHVGYIQEFEFKGEGLPPSADMRVKMVIDLSQPLIPGCFVPLEGHSETKCRITEEVAARRLKSRVAAIERQGMRVLYGPRNSTYYSNLIRGLPIRERYRNPEANLVRPEEPEDVPMEDRNLSGDGGSDSEDSSDNSGGTRLGLGRDPYAQFYPADRSNDRDSPRFSNELTRVVQSFSTHVSSVNLLSAAVHISSGDCPRVVDQPPDLSLNLNHSSATSLPPLLSSANLVNRSTLMPPITSNFEVGESSSRPTLFYRRRGNDGRVALPNLSIAAPPPSSLPQPSLQLLNLMPEPTVTLISPPENEITNVANCFIQAGKQLARSLRLSGSRVHPCSDSEKSIAIGRYTQSEGGYNFRESFSDLRWGEKNRLKTLNRWSDKGAFALWRRNASGQQVFKSKAISDDDMARQWGLQVDADIMDRARKRKSPSPSSLDSTGSNNMKKLRIAPFVANRMNAAEDYSFSLGEDEKRFCVENWFRGQCSSL
uniref:DUF4283 domain-containing protein n=1 Tax=Chenopodium quinoa TaxID=63459 RepID=A0A803MI38_CHEQI